MPIEFVIILAIKRRNKCMYQYHSMLQKISKVCIIIYMKSALWQAVGLVFKFGYTITIPLVALALAGRFLDKKFDSSPLLLLTGIVLSLIVSSIMLLIKVKKVMEEIK